MKRMSHGVECKIQQMTELGSKLTKGKKKQNGVTQILLVLSQVERKCSY